MPAGDKIHAVEFWNDVSERLQEIVNESVENLHPQQQQQISPKRNQHVQIKQGNY